ncbi:MAG: hypothetical protein EOP93_16725, partial [Lysobacteraceae bacterium]
MTDVSFSKPPAAAPAYRRIIGVAALAMAALVAGCSTIKLAYESFPSLTYFWINGYVDLEGDQSPQVREALANLHQWHRRNELPLYAELLTRASQLAPGEVKAAEVCGLFDDMRTRFVALAEHAEPATATLATRLTPAQLRNMEEKYADNNRKFRKEWIDVSREKRLERRYEEILKRSEDFYGRLGPAQRDAIRQQVAQSVFNPTVALAERVRRQRDAVQTIERLHAANATVAQARPEIHAWLQRGLRSPDADYRAYEQKLRDEGCSGFAAAHATTTPEQREKARQ